MLSDVVRQYADIPTVHMYDRVLGTVPSNPSSQTLQLRDFNYGFDTEGKLRYSSPLLTLLTLLPLLTLLTLLALLIVGCWMRAES
jgi:hypothetical protein